MYNYFVDTILANHLVYHKIHSYKDAKNAGKVGTSS